VRRGGGGAGESSNVSSRRGGEKEDRHVRVAAEHDGDDESRVRAYVQITPPWEMGMTTTTIIPLCPLTARALPIAPPTRLCGKEVSDKTGRRWLLSFSLTH